MPQFDVSTYTSQVFWLVITFGVLFLLVWRVMAPRVADVLENRQKRINDSLGKAADIKKEAEAAIEAYEKALAESRAEAQAMIAAANVKLAEEAAKREAELSAKLAEQVAKSEAAIAAAVEEALGSVREAAVEVAAAASERFLGEGLSDKDVASAVDTAMKPRG